MNRTIGTLTVSPLGLGCMGMSLAYGRPDRAEAIRTLRRAVDLGVDLFDTADVYGRGANERLLGRALGPQREHVVVATKVGLRTNLAGIPNRVDGRPSHLRTAIEQCLTRLRTDVLDLVYLHRIDPRIPVEESIGALADAVTTGKIRQIGVSEPTAEELRRAHTTHPVAAVQTEWSLFTRDIEDEVAPTARALGITIVPYAPLGRGMLTADSRATTRLPLLDFRRTLPRWRKANLTANLAAVDSICAIAERHHATPAQVALAWLLAQGDDVVPIPGTSRVRNLEANLGALQLHLTPADLTSLDQITVTGDRYARPSPTPGVG